MELEKSTVKRKQSGEKWIILWTYLKILLLIGINIVAFLSIPSFILWIVFGVELLIGIIIKIKIEKILPIIKFLAINLIPMYLVFYFVDNDWIQALFYFGEYTSKIFILLMSLIIFNHTTPIPILVNSLAKISLPRRYAVLKRMGSHKRIIFILTTMITFIPTLSAQLRSVVKSQKARGYKINLFRLKPILVPVVLNFLNLSMDLSLSLESRGFDFYV